MKGAIALVEKCKWIGIKDISNIEVVCVSSTKSVF